MALRLSRFRLAGELVAIPFEVGKEELSDEVGTQEADESEHDAPDRELRHEALSAQGLRLGEHASYCGLERGRAAEAAKQPLYSSRPCD